jgi:carbon monoxide dehydrogenase subunit G
MTVLQLETEVDASPERVWEVVADPKNLPNWDRHVSRVTGAPPDGLRKGSRYTTELSFMGARAKVDAAVLDIDPPRYSKIRLTGLMDATIETWVDPDGDGRSRLRHRIDYRFRGGPLGDIASGAVRVFGAQTLLMRGVLAQKRQAESGS